MERLKIGKIIFLSFDKELSKRFNINNFLKIKHICINILKNILDINKIYLIFCCYLHFYNLFYTNFRIKYHLLVFFNSK